MEGFSGAIIEIVTPVFHFFSLDLSHSHNNTVHQVDPLLPISFEIVAMVYLIDRIGILQAFEDEVSH
jgi:hypothetical protein